MRREEFNSLLEERIKKIKQTLDVKSEKYQRDEDKLHHFRVAAGILGGTPQWALWCFLVKHLASIKDMAEDEENPSDELIDEKIGDAINYLILLEMLFKEDKNLRTLEILDKSGEI